jgi:hypothetical protein
MIVIKGMITKTRTCMAKKRRCDEAVGWSAF